MEHRRKRTARSGLVAALALLLTLPLGGGPAQESAEAHPVGRFYRFDKDVRKHRWRDGHRRLRRSHRRFHARNPNVTDRRHRRFHHRRLLHLNRGKHLHDVVARQEGGASWYDMPGQRGACGVRLSGLYAAHRHWPCGTKVSVRRGSRYVVVQILDRGPFVKGRKIDLAKEAFRRIGDLGEGHINVKLYRLRKAQ